MLETVAAEFLIPVGGAHLNQALTHPSLTNEQRSGVHNQRLEFLGDAILEWCSSEILYERFPEADEGELTRRRAQLVNADSLAAYARRTSLPSALLLGKGAEANGLRDSTNVLADAVEAMIAAAYLDAGVDAARALCERIIDDVAEQGLAQTNDPKTELQESAQSHRLGAPSYRVVDSGGPDHKRWFEMVVVLGGCELGRGRGRSKRVAERAAAESALRQGTVELLAAQMVTAQQEPGNAASEDVG